MRPVPWQALRADLAAEAIARVLEGTPAEREIDRTLRAHRHLTSDERAALVEAIFGVALWRRRLAWAAESREPMALLSCLLRDIAGFPNALRPLPPPREPATLADRWSLPDWLEATLLEELGAEEAEAFCAAISVSGPICLRANRLRCTREQLAEELARKGIGTRPAERAPDALIVTTPRPNLTALDCWRRGWFEPQDEGSQLAGALAQSRGTVLDLCAGAGGKSLLLAAGGARVLAHDTDAEKLQRLKVRAARAGAEIAIVAEPVRAETVLVDAPCSELGVLRRGPDARWLIDPATFPALEQLQRQLLGTAARCAEKRIVYVTCTLRRAENEAQTIPGWRPAAPPMKLLPHRHGTDGFFASVWERTEEPALPATGGARRAEHK